MAMLRCAWLLSLSALVGVARCSCPCDDVKHCENIAETTQYEVYAFNRGATDLTAWRWKSFTALIAPADFEISNKHQAAVMCTTHGNSRKFGITVKMDLVGALHNASKEAVDWVDEAVTRRNAWHADIVNIDLIPYFLTDHHSTMTDHLELVQVMKNLKHKLKAIPYNTEISCMVPWQPPCAERTRGCDFSWISTDVCDSYVINEDSFADSQDEICTARATVPFSKVLYGISKYNTHLVPLNRIILAVPWHGYDYTCFSLLWNQCITDQQSLDDSSLMKCKFPKEKVSLGSVMTDHPEEFKNHKRNALYQAPYFNYNDKGQAHQVWFEDYQSLESKYKLAKDMQMKGIAVMYGDDLGQPFYNKKDSKAGADLVWSWLAHDMMVKTAHLTVKQDLHTADTVAGVGVGMLILGVALGVVFTYLALQRHVRKPKPAFHDDGHFEDDDDYKDDPAL